MNKLFRRVLAGVLLAGPVTGAMAADLTGDWVFQAAPSFPRFTKMAIRHDADGLRGTITSEWYGDLPMLDLKVVGEGPAGDRLVFHIDNGNPKLKPLDLTLTPDGPEGNQGVRLTGQVWYEKQDATAHRATAAEMAALAFSTYPLPAPAHVPSNGLARTPPMGWSSWNKFAEAIDDKTVREIADALVRSGLRDAGYVYVNIDDGWQGERGPDGVLRPNAKFPDMKALADYVHARGLKLGIYSSPGPKTCAGYAGSYGHVEQDARTWAEWGVDYLKYDLCSGEGFYHTAETVQAVYQQMGTALVAAGAATGRPIVYSLCEYGRFDVGAWGRDVGGNLWRTTGDIEDTYASMSAIGFDKNGVPRHTGPGGWNDPDMLEVGNGGMSVEEYRTHISLWAMMAAPLLMGNDARSMTRDTLALLGNAEVIAIDQDPLGRQGLPVRKRDGAEVWTRPLADGSVAVGLFNRTDKPVTLAADWPALGLGDHPNVRDLWAHRSVAPGAVHTVPAHGVVLLRATR
ncbi:glycoside hydrolase family 27 protein [Nitrospirillum sp. BR 11164]|uniref:glycoside hydrolase family 27 protein n=1 Tax=Nitrospirillum sp. BR 11164 TaxID=3104324 RepID=UPI002AFE0801|nr:glycoside hydrolase family 27 protein [Nitrospirillum sp. BR 11164]MEA1652731.1 glycoside hydrolase family 27 protein [Nitrospirillum sp. BR 11164]